MTYAPVNEITVEQIPVIDIGTLFCDAPDYAGIGLQLRAAAEDVGFFYVKNHSISTQLSKSAFDVSARFFASAEDNKQSVKINPFHRGLLEIGNAKMEGQARPDLKESFLWGVDVAPENEDFLAGNVMLPANQWPHAPFDMRETLNEYMAQAHLTGKQLLRAIAVSLDIEQDYFVQYFDKPVTRGSLIHYPPQTTSMGVDQYGVSPHTDYGTMTLLAQDDTGGLRVRDRQGDWITAHPIENTLVVNVGDLLARWSNDRFQSTEHAVVNASGRERFSIAIALDPNWETPVKPVTNEGESSRYDTVNCGDYIQGRFNRSFSYRQTNGNEHVDGS